MRALLLSTIVALPAAAAAAPFDDDMVEVPGVADFVDFGDRSPAADPFAAYSDGAPRVFYLAYADGTTTASGSCSGTVPKFTCKWGGADGNEACKRKIQTFLDRWYVDFNVVFTLTRPSSGSFYTEIVTTAGGAWCGRPADVLGIAPFFCADQNGGTCYTFSCDTAQVCAQTIAQEQAHLVGLEHTTSKKDLMSPTAPCSTCDGFDDADNAVISARCRSTQNSYAMMKSALGAWPGGDKPSVFPGGSGAGGGSGGGSGGGNGPCNDAAAPTVAITEPASGAKVGADFDVKASGSDDCGIKEAKIEALGASLVTAGAGPFVWQLRGMSGRVKIDVTITDAAGKTATTSITVDAPDKGGGAGGGDKVGGGGCAVSRSRRIGIVTPIAIVALLALGLRRRRAAPSPQ